MTSLWRARNHLLPLTMGLAPFKFTSSYNSLNTSSIKAQLGSNDDKICPLYVNAIALSQHRERRKLQHDRIYRVVPTKTMPNLTLLYWSISKWQGLLITMDTCLTPTLAEKYISGSTMVHGLCIFSSTMEPDQATRSSLEVLCKRPIHTPCTIDWRQAILEIKTSPVISNSHNLFKHASHGLDSWWSLHLSFQWLWRYNTHHKSPNFTIFRSKVARSS